MTTPYEAYNEGALALAQEIGIVNHLAHKYIIESNPYPEDENWTLFEQSDDIDYGPLDGRKAKLVHESGVKVTFAMHRSSDTQPSYMSSAWARPAYIGPVFRFGWYGLHGWKLYIKGELPTKRVTADTLEPGTGFDGVAPNGRSYHSLIRIISAQGKSLVLSTSSIEYFKAKEVEVTEVYGIGTFQKPTKENQ